MNRQNEDKKIYYYGLRVGNKVYVTSKWPECKMKLEKNEVSYYKRFNLKREAMNYIYGEWKKDINIDGYVEEIN